MSKVYHSHVIEWPGKRGSGSFYNYLISVFLFKKKTYLSNKVQRLGLGIINLFAY